MDIRKAKILLADVQKRQSDFKLINYVINKEGDEWAQYKQCLRELDGRVKEFESIEMKIKSLQNYKKSVHYFYSIIINRLIKNDKLIKLSVRKQIDDLLESKNSIMEEIFILYEAGKKLKKIIGKMSDEKRYSLELQSAVDKAKRLAYMDLFTVRAITKQTLSYIIALPIELQNDIMNEVTKSVDKKTPLDSCGMLRLLNAE